jgi:2-keto-4-pentenoate hydratase/2-oxohepta-3-ene-1,7-dioic acid hydratase in catechol pathway
VKIVRMLYQGRPMVGRVEDQSVVEMAQTIDELIGGAAPTDTGVVVPFVEDDLLAPLPESCRGMLCVGINYQAHQEESKAEFSADVPAHPIFFFKTVSSTCGPYADLVLERGVSDQFDWEVELGVVIGKGGRDIDPEDAMDHVFGYTVVNDITARDLQKRHQQWHLGKNVDASSPVGPWIATVDELGFPPGVGLTLRVNGVEKQRAETSLMIFDIPTQIACVSRTMALEPGDVISTGTPAGVGFTRHPAEFLDDGDVVEAEVEKLGVLRNRVRTVAPVPSV